MTQPNSSLVSALNHLAETLTVENLAEPPATHSTRLISGWESRDSVSAVATYLAGCIANAFQANLQIVETLKASAANAVPTLLADTYKIIGESNDDPAIDVIHARNPWIAEGMMHLLGQLSKSGAGTFSPIPLHAKTGLTVSVRRPGIDFFGICGPPSALRFSTCEGKSTADDVAGAIGEAVSLFRSVERGERAFEVRSLASALASALEDAERKSLYLRLWDPSHTFSACVVHGKKDFDTQADRNSIKENLTCSPTDIVVCVVFLNSYLEFFDRVADDTRSQVQALDV